LRLLGNGELTTDFDTDCTATREVLNRAGDKWSVLAVVLPGEAPMRFNELRRAVHHAEVYRARDVFGRASKQTSPAE